MPPPVHLQIYDGKVFANQWQTFWHDAFIYAHTDATHILPNLFPFATPAKFCFRAISSFIRHVIHTPPETVLSTPPLSDLLPLETAGIGAKTQERSGLVA